LNALFVQRWNLINPTFYRMLVDAMVFRYRSKELLSGKLDRITLGRYLDKNGYSRAFRDQFIIPMGAAIWSSDPESFEDFPARYFVEFFNHHGFLNWRDQPQWLTIKGGSRQYVAPLTASYKDRIRLNSPVRSVLRQPNQVKITTAAGDADLFDQVIIAAHSDQALAMLDEPTEREHEILGAISYQPNLTALHTDASVLPPYRQAWAAWNYHIPRERRERVSLTYNMNLLQNLSSPQPFCVTLNRPDAVDTDLELCRMTYHHPLYTPKSLEARKRWHEISGIDRIHYCGAYWHYGFHEDGVKSALAVAKWFNQTL
jgi:predicted NAD/FAD-binding protein